MIKVCHVVSDTNFGGAGRVLLNYCRYYDRSQYQLSAVVPKESKLVPYLKEACVEVLEVNGLYDRSYRWKDVRLLTKLFRQHDFELIHGHGALSARIAAKKCRLPVIYTRHSVFDLPKRMTSFPFKQLNGFLSNRLTDGIIAVSPAAKELLIATGCDPKRIRVIFNGVAPVEPGPRVFREKYAFNPQDLVLGIVARLEAVKGHSDLLEAMAMLPKNVKLLIAGTGREEQALIEQSQRLNLADQVKFCGFLDDIAGLMNSLDLQINASFGTEATSMALLEGFSLGVPAIVSDFGGNPYVVENGVSGFVVPRRNPGKMAAAIKKVIHDPRLLERLGAGAKQAYEKNFRAEEMTRQTEEYYQEVLKRHG